MPILSSFCSGNEAFHPEDFHFMSVGFASGLAYIEGRGKNLSRISQLVSRML